MYKVKCCNEIYKKHIDQLRFCPDIETELEVKDTSHLKQNLSLHPITHIIESNQSHQTTTSSSSDKILSDNPTSMSSSQSPDNPVPIGTNIDTSPQQSDKRKSEYYEGQTKTKLYTPSVFERLRNLRGDM